MTKIIINDIDGDTFHTIFSGTIQDAYNLSSEIIHLINGAVREGFSIGKINRDNEEYIVMVIAHKQYIISATYEDMNGVRCVCNPDYALGEYADTIFDSIIDAQNVINDLREDIGTVVDSSIEYNVVEY
jgi:hypothetical protein